MSDMKVQVLIDLLYDSGKAQQAAKDLQLIAEATEAADKASQQLTKDFDLGEQAGAAFGTRLDTTVDSANAAADAVLKAQDALSNIGAGFDTAGSGADAAAAAFERTGGALSAIEDVDPFGKLDGSLARAEEQAQQLAGALRAIEAGEAVPAGIDAVDAALREQTALAEQARAAIETPAMDGALAAVEGTVAALRQELTLEEELRRLLAEPAPPSAIEDRLARMKAEEEAARTALAEPATDGALSAVEATNKALAEEARLAAEAHAAVAEPAGDGAYTFPNGAAVPPLSSGWEDEEEERRRPPAPRAHDEPVPMGGGHDSPGIVGTIMGFEELEKSWELAKESIHMAADTAAEHALMKAAGFKPEEVEQLDKAASETSRAVPTFSNNEMLELARDARSILGSSEHASEAMPNIAKLAGISEAYNPGHGLDGLAVMLKGAESGSFTASPEKFENYLDAVSRSAEVFGKTIRPDDWGLFFKYAGTAGQNMSMDFVREKLPHLIQELGGNSAGQMFQTLDRAMVGGIMTSRATEKFLEYGLLDESKVHKDHGKYKIDAGALNHGDEAVKDFAAYIQTYLKPLFEAKHLTPAEQEHEISAMFSNQIGARGVALIMNQGGIIEKNAKQIRDAHGLAGYDSLRSEDPHLVTRGLESQFENFVQIAGGPLMPAYLGAQNTITSLLTRLNKDLEKAPEIATGLMGGVAAGGAYVGAKSLQMVPVQAARTAGAAAEGLIGGAARFAGPVGAAITTVELARLAEHEFERMTLPDAMKYAFDQIPGWREHAEIARRDADDFKRSPEAARGRALMDLDRPNRGGMPLEVPDYLRHAPGDPIHVVVDGEKSGAALGWRPPFGTPEHPAGLAIPVTPGGGHGAPTGGTATPSLAQPVVNNTTNNSTTNAPVSVSAPVSVIVNVTSPTAAPGAVGSAVGAAAAGAVTSAVKQSAGVLHDGYGPH